MPDITMCVNTVCPLRMECLRFRARPDQLGQSYTRFEPEGDECADLMPIEPRDRVVSPFDAQIAAERALLQLGWLP